MLSLTVQPYSPEPDVIALRIIRARAGAVPIPLDRVLSQLSKTADAMRLHVEWRQTGGEPVALLSLPNEDDELVVRIETLRLDEGEIFLAGTTERRGKR